ncbi:MAG TPA: hypothetical protein VGF24_37165 [Vicinamibacterales bacterium]|jgi:hypothetical protein
MSAVCKSCGAEIVWAKTIKGRPIPLDRAPSQRGNVVLSDEGTALVYNSPGAIAPRYQDSPRYLSHFATCPDADEHRK